MVLEKKISSWLKDYLLSNNLNSFVIGISGGIDSAVTSTLCAMTGCKTTVVTMPIHQNPNETDRGEKHISKGILAETFIHEATHASLDPFHASNVKWLAAQKNDPEFESLLKNQVQIFQGKALSF